jgi:hypothetical protein
MSMVARPKLLLLLLLPLLSCREPSGPSSGSLALTVLGLPSGSAAAITISGPNGFTGSATASQTFSPLAPGAYTITAASVTVGSVEYTPNPISQTVGVANNPASASVFYAQATGNLAVNITGLGSASTAAVTVTGPGYVQEVPATTTLFGLDPGSYTVTARDTVANGGTPHTASPASQTVPVIANSTDSANVSYSPPPANGFVNLRIAGLYITQSTQTYGSSVPLVRHRDGYLRIFVVADRANTALPTVKVRFYSGLVAVDSVTVSPPALATSTPTAVDESALRYTWNVPVAGTRIQPGLGIAAVINPTPGEIDPSDNTFPASGPLAMDVRSVPAVDVTFVPVLQRGLPVFRRRGDISESNKGEFLELTQKMHPISGFNAVIRADYLTDTPDTLQDLNGNQAWGTILTEIDARRAVESSLRYYYGVAKVSYTSGIAGVALVSTSTQGGRAGLGWDYLPSGSTVMAHELGHNWGRIHSPCGGPADVDPQYPRPDGSTGNYGLDVATVTLEPPTRTDIMGYCDDKWIGEYTYRGVMNYLLSPSLPLVARGNEPVQPGLLVWGHIRNGELTLEPAFQVNARPSLPQRSGPYTLSGRAEDGSTMFVLSFTPNQIADAVVHQQSFVFVVPLSAAQAARLATIQVSGKGRRAVLGMSGAGVTGGPPIRPNFVEARRVAGNRVALRWDNRAHPMVMVRDPDTGEVLSFARSGDVELPVRKGSINIIMSNGVRSQFKRMQIVP